VGSNRVKLYVCYGTWTAGGSVHKHPCGEAHKALRAAGHTPRVIHAYGLGPLPGIINDRTPRREVKALTGSYWVPVLVTDEGVVVQGSRRIIDWARAHPAAEATARAASA